MGFHPKSLFERVVAVDRRWSAGVDLGSPELLDRVAFAFDRAGGRGVVRGATLVAVGGALAYRKKWRGFRAWAVTEALTPLTVNSIKLVSDRDRPANARVDPFGTSFPSGHTAYAGATTVALVLLVADGDPPPAWLWATATAGTAGMVWSRTYLQAHWLSDAVTGALIGVSVSLAVFRVIGPASSTRSTITA